MKTAVTIFRSGLLLLMLVFASCTKEGPQGDIGPIGPAGLNGTNGINGTDGMDGADGQDGEDGNAEVLYSDWIPANFTGTSSVIKYMNIDFPASLPSAVSIKNSHVLLVYFTGYGDGSVYLLPILSFRGAQFTYGFGSGSAAVEDIFIRAEALSGDLTEFQIGPARGNKFRYVIIPPNINISGKSSTNQDPLYELKNAGVDINNYEQVATYFNID